MKPASGTPASGVSNATITAQQGAIGTMRTRTASGVQPAASAAAAGAGSAITTAA
ncbi:hypothetical protein D3C83_268770 [compost metagenome]